MNIDPIENRIVMLEARAEFLERVGKEAHERIMALEKVNEEFHGVTSNLFRDSPTVELIKMEKRDTDPRIGRLCWVWMRGQYCKNRAYRITSVDENGLKTEANSNVWDHAELVKPEEL